MEVKKCLILNNREGYPEDLLDHIAGLRTFWYQDSSEAFSPEAIFDIHPDTQLLVTNMLDLSAAKLQKLPRLELILTLTTSTEYIDKEYCREHHIKILNTAKYGGTSVAEHAVALMMTAAKRIVNFNSEVRTGNFQLFQYRSMELFGKKAGILGLGTIGKHVAHSVKGLGMEILYCNRHPTDFEPGAQVDFTTLLSESDVLFLTLPQNKDSEGIMNSKAFSQMKQGAILISTSPDEIIDFEALREALESSHLSYAGVDLHHDEERYMHIPNLLITPRRAWYTKEAFERRTAIWTKTISDYMNETVQQQKTG